MREFDHDLSQVPDHPVLAAMTDVLCSKTGTDDRDFFTVVSAYFVSKMAASMRAVAVTRHAKEIPVNCYAIAVAPSGHGKGYAVFIAERQFLAPFERMLTRQTFPRIANANLWAITHQRAGEMENPPADMHELHEETVAEFEKASFAFGYDSGTVPGIKQLRHKLLMAGIGALSFEVDEIGLNLSSAYVKDLLALHLELYEQGMVKTKVNLDTAMSKRARTVDGGTPANVLLFGEETLLFDGETNEELFTGLLTAGYARRCLFGYGIESEIPSDLTAEEVYANLTSGIDDEAVDGLAAHFETLAEEDRIGWKAVMGDEVGKAHVAYGLDNKRAARKLPAHRKVLRFEIQHRHSKAIRLAAALAFADRSEDITMLHFLQAVKVVEESAKALDRLLSQPRPFERLGRFITDEERELTHHEIHEELPFYKSKGNREELLQMAMTWAYRNGRIIRRKLVDGMEFIVGTKLHPVDMSRLTFSASTDFAANYEPLEMAWGEIWQMTQTPGWHWCPHTFEGNHRANENVRRGIDMIVLDVDGEFPLDSFHEVFAGTQYLTYTTASHRKVCEKNPTGGDRYRVLFPLSHRLELDPDEFKEFMNNVHLWLPWTLADDSSNKAAQKWTTHEGEYRYNDNPEATPLDVLPFIPRTTRSDQLQARSERLRDHSALQRYFAPLIVDGARNKNMIRYALVLVDSGWTEEEIVKDVVAFDAKLAYPMGEKELHDTVLQTVRKRCALKEQRMAA